MPGSQPTKNLEAEHRPKAIRRRLRNGGGGNLGDAVLGAIDGGITSFAVVAGAVGGGFGSLVVVVLGFASLVADGFSMAVSNYLGRKSESEQGRQARREEERHAVEIPEGQREEIRHIFADKGLEGENLDCVVDTFMSDPRLAAGTVVQEVFGLQPEGGGRPVRAGLVTFAAFLAAGLIPLVPFLIPGTPTRVAFMASIAATAAAFLVIGVLKGRVLGQGMLRSGAETLAVGGGAAVLAYLVGMLIRQAAGVSGL